jgi:hypothetical protein
VALVEMQIHYKLSGMTVALSALIMLCFVPFPVTAQTADQIEPQTARVGRTGSSDSSGGTTITTTGVGKYNVPVSDTTTHETIMNPGPIQQTIEKHTVYTRLCPADASQTIVESKSSDSIKYGRQNYFERLRNFRSQLDKAVSNNWVNAAQSADLNAAYDKLVSEEASVKGHNYPKSESDDLDAHLNTFNIQLSDALSKENTKSPVESRSVTAIDIAIDPDATMVQHAKDANAALLKNNPSSFALDASHHPHITLVQRFVNTDDLDKVYAATDKVLVKEKPTTWKLKASKFNFFKDKTKPTGLECIVVESNPDLIRLQQELLDAVAPYTVANGTSAAFETTPEQPEINDSTIHFVTHFLETSTGKKFSPHVSTGVGTVEFLEKVVAKPFHEFSFSPASVSVYKLGNYGTARKELKSFQGK